MKSEEIAALRFHTKLKRMHRLGFYYNLGHYNYWFAWYHLFCYTLEAVAVEFHRRQVRR